MDVLKLMKARYSCRKFSDELIKDEDVSKILETGRLAPSAQNKQPWRFLVVKSAEGLNKVDAATRCRFHAPVAILVCFDKEVSAKNEKVNPDYGWVDCGIAISQMALEAEELGLGSCIVGAYDPDVARKEFNLPKNIVPYLFLMVGQTDMPPSEMHRERADLKDIVFNETF